MYAVVFFCLVAAAFADHPSGYGTRCYDCNYAPSGYSKNNYGWAKVAAGTELCALTRPSDGEQLDRWNCDSGYCFIRKDPNGLVYRGCANRENLPIDVDPKVQCQYQGSKMYQSLWYFCKGDLCNDGALGDKDRCGHGSYKDSFCNPYKCKNNPSGLFADPYDKNGFIQCGCDFQYGQACTCCKSFKFSCPKGSTWDDGIKACVNAQRSYAPVH
ncbi:uncharacterized protein LOC106163944 [Lingula anatina]|uniref:Uncharacterized protein LOC106163944 n=1 Tax=Lingula anatina TaxID=7574 RepID=A0A1S3IHZ8_LINAN|nr:uncharacterized protein LOC106163944 [Lingula anatina]|eukprot:XP_013397119.1 uncharacterized protein LOC106163944 [Lingula anatina]